MKKMAIACVALMSVVMLSVPRCVSAKDLYDKMAAQLSAGAKELTNKKVAVLPFAYVDGRKSKGGNIIAERLTTRIINLKKLEVIERSMLDKVMGELKLQVSGVIASDSAKELGKVLGVEAIITGSLVAMQKGKVEVNARLIRTETAEAIVASNVVLEKDWLDETEKAKEPAPVQVYQAAAKRAPSRGPVGRSYGFFDILFGFGSNKMNLKFENSVLGQKCLDLGIDGPGGTYRSISWTDLETGGGVPFALRAGLFGKGMFGGDVEISYESHNIAKQKTTWRINDIQQGTFEFYDDKYLTVKSFIMSGDLLLRIPNEKVEPYIGMGLGLSINSVEAIYVKGYTQSIVFSKPTKDTGVGLIFRIPLGVRVRVADNLNLLAEGRFQVNSFSFNRDRAGEKDSVVIKGTRFMFGMGFLF